MLLPEEEVISRGRGRGGRGVSEEAGGEEVQRALRLELMQQKGGRPRVKALDVGGLGREGQVVKGKAE